MIVRQTLHRSDFRFELRPYEHGASEALVSAALESKAHVGRWMAWLRDEYDIDEARAWTLGAMQVWDEGKAYEFQIYDREDGVLAGCAGINAIDRKDLVCNLGYWVRTSKLRLGAARQATQLLAEFGFEVVGLNRIEIVVATGNVPSQRVAGSVGAVFEGVQGQRIKVGESIYDARMYALLRRARKRSA